MALGRTQALTWLQLAELDLLGRREHNAAVRLPEGHHGRLRQRHLRGPDQRSRLGWLLDHLEQITHSPREHTPSWELPALHPSHPLP